MIIVAIGANLPSPDGASPLEVCRRAADGLHGLCGLTLVAVSGWYATEPVPPSGQPPYVNGVARLSGAVDPAALLAALQAVEASSGRRRSVANAARTLDLDIIAMGGLVRTAPDPILPHPRMHGRGFVLIPLLEVAPDWRHPASGKAAATLLAELPPQAVTLLAPSHLRNGAASPTF